MDGLKTLGAVAEDSVWESGWFLFEDRHPEHSHRSPVPFFPCAIAQLWPNPRGPGAQYCFSKAVHGSLLANFFQHGYSSGDFTPTGSGSGCSQHTPTGVKIAIIQSDIPPENGNKRWYRYHRAPFVNIEPKDFACTWKALNAHPRLGKMINCNFLRDFEFWGRTADNEGISGYLFLTSLLGAKIRLIWSVRQQGESSEFDVRCIILSQSKVSDSADDLDWSLLEGKSVKPGESLASVMAHLKAFKEDSHSPLYLPFAISVFAMENWRQYLAAINLQVAEWSVRDKDGPSWGVNPGIEQDELQRLSMLRLIEENMPMYLERLEDVVKGLNNIELLCSYLVTMAKELPDTAKSEDVCRSNESILAALYYLQQELNGLREVVRSLESHINKFMSLRSHYLSQKDADRNNKMAKTTYELAQAARQDSSAMKTIAVLTMAFLPATFLATLLSMPSLNWDQRKHFVIYWILAIPITVATFVLWALVTQRQQVRKWLKDVHVSLRRRNRARKEQKQRKRKEMERQRATNDEAPGKV